MASEKAKLYLYLARRDKSEVKMLMTIPGPIYPAARITDIKDLKLPSKAEKELGRTIHENRMLWEPWIQGASNYEELRESLRSQGYKNIPAFHTPKHIELTRNSKSIQAHLPPPVQTMTRRKSQLRSSNKSPVNKKASRVNFDKKMLPINIGNDSPIFKKFK